MPERTWPDTEPRLLDLLPLIHVAWSDLELSDAEITSIRDACDCEDDGLRDAVETWLDPEAPPSTSELAAVRRWIRDRGDAPSSEARADLEEALGTSSETARRAWLAPPWVHAWPDPQPSVARFDVERLADRLDGPYAEQRRAMRTWLEAFEHRYGDTVEQQREKTLGRLLALCDEGFGRLAYPQVTTEHQTMGPFLAAFETLAVFDLSLWTKAGVQLGLFGGSIYFLGTERHHALLPQVAAGELLGCFAMTETGHGSNVRGLGTTATWDGERGGFVVHTPQPGDRKDYIGNAAAHGRLATVFAQLRVGDDDHGVHALLVPLRDEAGEALPGVTLVDNGKKMGLNGVDNGRITLDEVFVPRDALLDRFGRVTEDGVYESGIASPSRRFFTMIGTLVGGRVSVANAALSASKVALAIAIRYATRRRQFEGDDGVEVLLARYPAHQRRLMPRLAAAVALDFALEDATRRYEEQAREDADRRELESLAAGLKAVATWMATDIVQGCREACGGAGYLSVNRFADVKADTDVFTTFEGDNTVLLQLVAKSLLGGFKQQFADERVLGMMRYLRQRADSAIHRHNPWEKRGSSSEHLRDASLQQELLAFRTQDQLVDVVGALRKRVGDGEEPVAAFNAVQTHALALARSHVEQGIVDRFVAAEQAEEDDDLCALLGRLRALHALHTIEADLGWFLERGYLASKQAGALRAEVDALCAEVAVDAPHVVEAFRLPESALSAPIAKG